jgi:butyryl-CoA dehydrogenase
MRMLPPRMDDKLYHDMILPEESLKIKGKAREFAVREIVPAGYDIAQKEERKKTFLSVFLRNWLKRIFQNPFSKRG